MSFLGQHFYIDAGVALPDKITEANGTVEDKMKSLQLNVPQEGKSDSLNDDLRIPTVSVENTDIENMSDDDLKELETSTSNITDDVKANIQKKSLSNVTPRSKTSSEPVKRRSKRYSSVFPLDQQTTNNIILKRRSLNIGPSESSKIPISFKYVKKFEETTNLKRSKSGSIQGFYSSLTKSNSVEKKGNTSKVRQPLNVEYNPGSGNTENGSVVATGNAGCKVGSAEGVKVVGVKENVPVVSDSVRINVPNRCNKDHTAKVSNLPVLVRRTQSEVRK